MAVTKRNLFTPLRDATKSWLPTRGEPIAYHALSETRASQQDPGSPHAHVLQKLLRKLPGVYQQFPFGGLGVNSVSSFRLSTFNFPHFQETFFPALSYLSPRTGPPPVRRHPVMSDRNRGFFANTTVISTAALLLSPLSALAQSAVTSASSTQSTTSASKD